MGSNGNYTNPFQGSVDIMAAGRFTAADANSGDNKAFMLVYNGIPEEACVDLATLDWGTGSGGGLVALGVNTSVKASNAGSCTGQSGEAATSSASGKAIVCGGSAVMTVDNAVKACSKTDGNVLYFKFY